VIIKKGEKMLKKVIIPGLGKIIPVFVILLFQVMILHSQEIDILIKGGHVIDPGNKIDGIMDVAVANGKILRVAASIPAGNAKKVIDAGGLYVTPGLIDIHTHVFVGTNNGFADGFMCISPDDITLKAGITTVVDAGTSGWRNFPVFKRQVIDRSVTRVLAFLNIAGSGMTGFPSEEDLNDMDARMTSLVIDQYPEIIVGVKIGHYRGSDWAPFDRALEAAKLSDVPLIVECHMPQYPLEEILGRLRPGDIYTHSYCTAVDRDCLLDENLKIKPFVMEAKKKGVRFDVGHGGGMFHFNIAVPAFRQGLKPDSFGSDLHRSSINSGMKNMLDIVSKFLNIGMSLQDAVYSATWGPAGTLNRKDLGNLGEGAVADIVILSLKEGKFGFIDTRNHRLEGTKKLEAEMTIRNGRIVWDQNGLSAENWLDHQKINQK